MTDIARLGLEVDSRQVKTADKALDDFTLSAKQADDAAEDLSQELKRGQAQAGKFAKAANDAGGNIGGVGRNAGMAGIQIQQFVGQIQGGQSAMVALSQQSADLGFVLGAPMVGVVVSLAAVIAGALIPSLMGADVASDELAEKIRELNKESKTLTENQRAALSIEIAKKIKEEIGEVEDYSEKLKENQDRLKEVEAAQESYGKRLGGSSVRAKRAATAISALKKEAEQLKEENILLSAAIDTANQSINQQNEETSKLNGQLTTEAELLSGLKDELKLVNEEIAKQKSEDAAEARRLSSVEAYATQLERVSDLTVKSTNEERLLFEMQKGRLKGVTEGEEKRLVALARLADEKAKGRTAEAEELEANKALAKTLEDELASALTGGSNKGFGEILKGFGDMLLQMAAQAAAADIIGGLFNASGKSGGSGTSNTQGLLSMASSFAGFFDQGGNIPSGSFGIAGENGPEIVRGPANVTSTKDTASIMGGGGVTIGNITVNGGADGKQSKRAAIQIGREVAAAVNAGRRGT